MRIAASGTPYRLCPVSFDCEGEDNVSELSAWNLANTLRVATSTKGSWKTGEGVL